LCSPPAQASALQQEVVAGGRKVSLHLREVPLRAALDSIFADSPEDFTMDAEIPDIRLTAKVDGLTVPAAVRLLVRLASVHVPGLTFHREGRLYRVLVQVAAPDEVFDVEALDKGPEAGRRVSLSLREVTLRAALSQLFQGTSVQYAVTPDVPDVPVTFNLRDVSLRGALRLLLRNISVRVPALTLGREDGVLILAMRPLGLGGGAHDGPTDRARQTASVNLKEVRLRAALAALLAGTGEKYTVEPNVPDVPVTLNLQDVEVRAGLRLLIDRATVGAPGLTLRQDNDRYVVSLQPETPSVR
ncbi:MAG TPA: STN domain-containing protein, partial [Armatimonadota bacterium]|nr:STN domain-containing protein [Armatimonadota bacterium]